MKKSKLIKLLQEIEGDPDIFLWNGVVGDWMDIRALEKLTLERQTVAGYSHYLNLERVVRDGKQPYTEKDCEKFYKSSGADRWEAVTYDPEFAEIRKKNLERKYLVEKVVFVIDAKPRGIETWDRVGCIRY